jgi:calcium-dependent protein kinase
MQQIEKGWFI